jgi:hypothetical protein
MNATEIVEPPFPSLATTGDESCEKFPSDPEICAGVVQVLPPSCVTLA